jgi:dissimilatory sulfite reductase (desulfoviridin) alpha/beta subunit
MGGGPHENVHEISATHPHNHCDTAMYDIQKIITVQLKEKYTEGDAIFLRARLAPVIWG